MLLGQGLSTNVLVWSSHMPRLYHVHVLKVNRGLIRPFCFACMQLLALLVQFEVLLVEQLSTCLSICYEKEGATVIAEVALPIYDCVI